MNTRHLVDPEIVLLLDQFPPFNFTRENLPEVRAMIDELFAPVLAAAPEYPDVEVQERAASL